MEYFQNTLIVGRITMHKSPLRRVRFAHTASVVNEVKRMRDSLQSLEEDLLPDTFMKIRVAMTQLHRDHDLPLDDAMFVVALSMAISAMDEGDPEKPVIEMELDKVIARTDRSEIDEVIAVMKSNGE